MSQVVATLVRLAAAGEFWQVDGAPMVSIDGRHLPARGKAFQAWLLNAASARRPVIQPTVSAVKDAQEILAAKALIGPSYQLWRRTGYQGNTVWVDCGERQAVEVTAKGWRIVGEVPIRFLEVSGQLPLPANQLLTARGDGVEAARCIMPLEGDAQWIMWLTWLAFALQPHGAFPILSLTGPPHAGKSTAAEVTKSFVDPNTTPLLFSPSNQRDLAAYANSGWALALDNVTHVPGWLSDALCGLSTGIGFAARELYSDADLFRVGGFRPLIITSLGGWASRGDLQDRTIQLALAPLTLMSGDVKRAVDNARPAVLAWLLDVLVDALGRTQAPAKYRFPWFLTVAQVVGERLGADGIGAFEELRHNTQAAAASDSPIVDLLVKLVARTGEWEGTTAQLLSVLHDEAGGQGRSTWLTWPRTAEGLGRMLRTLPPCGVAVATHNTPAGIRVILRKEEV